MAVTGSTREAPTEPQAPRRGRSLLVLVAGLAVGIGATVGVSALSGGDDTAVPTLGREEGSGLTLDGRADVSGPRSRSSAPADAVSAFLAAEQAADREASFALLSDEMQAVYGTPAAWAADHPDALPPVTGFVVEDAGDGSGDTAEVVTLTSYASSLDSISGLVPARARTTWVAVLEDGGWGVDLSATTQEILLPPDDQVGPAAQAWLDAATACEEPPTLRGRLAGTPSLAEPLCGSTATAAAVGPLEQVDAAPLANSYGADVVSWARTVDVEGAEGLLLVLAPVDDTWTVFAALPDR